MTGAATIQVVAFSNSALPPFGTQFTINGNPFSGTGFGFNPVSGKLDLGYDTSGANPAFNTTGYF